MKTKLFIVAISIIAANTNARSYNDFICLNTKCGYKASIGEGPTELFEYVSGYCKKCEQIVELSWRERPKVEKSPNIRDAWDPKSGENKKIFNCPKCEDLIFSIKNAKEMKHCPKCKTDKVKVSDVTHIDD